MQRCIWPVDDNLSKTKYILLTSKAIPHKKKKDCLSDQTEVQNKYSLSTRYDYKLALAHK